MIAQANTGQRVSQFRFGAALLLRAAVDAYIGLQTRDAEFLASARSGAAVALMLLLPRPGHGRPGGKQGGPLGCAC